MRPPARAPERLLAWLYTGPIGHLYGGAADVAELFVRWQWSRVRERAARAASPRRRA